MESNKQQKSAVTRPLAKAEDGLILPFTTNSGTKYTPIRPGTAVGIRRYTHYSKLRIVLGVGKTFQQITDTLREHELLLASDRPFEEIRLEAILSINSLRRGIVEMSQARYDQSFYLASIFILREGEDPANWSIEQANEKIEDWADSMIDENDLFFFALNTVNGYKEQYRRIKDELTTEATRLQGFTPTSETVKGGNF